MSTYLNPVGTPGRTAKLLTLALAGVLACGLSLPTSAFAVVRVDQTELAQGENAVGGGKATLADSSLDMSGVSAGGLYTDQDLSVNFNGGNNIGNVTATGSASVDLNFSGENEVKEVHAYQNSSVEINANGENEFEEVDASDQSKLTINVTGENEFEEINGYDDANITIRGTGCQKKDIIELGEDEKDTSIITERGSLVIDHATIKLHGEIAIIGSDYGTVRIDTSKIGKDDGNAYTHLRAGATMDINESVIDISGTIHAVGKMTIRHSDIKATAPDPKFSDTSPYRVYSDTGIDLIREKNGKVKQGAIDGTGVFYLDTDGNEGKSVELEADGKPAYYHCDRDCDSTASSPMLRTMGGTGDETNPLAPLAIAAASVTTAAYASRRRSELPE